MTRPVKNAPQKSGEMSGEIKEGNLKPQNRCSPYVIWAQGTLLKIITSCVARRNFLCGKKKLLVWQVETSFFHKKKLLVRLRNMLYYEYEIFLILARS